MQLPHWVIFPIDSTQTIPSGAPLATDEPASTFGLNLISDRAKLMTLTGREGQKGKFCPLAPGRVSCLANWANRAMS